MDATHTLAINTAIILPELLLEYVLAVSVALILRSHAALSGSRACAETRVSGERSERHSCLLSKYSHLVVLGSPRLDTKRAAVSSSPG